MAHLHKKIKNGRPYYYIREIARVNGKPKVVKQIYLGTPDRLLRLIEGTQKEIQKISVEEFGSLWMAHQIDSQVDLVSIVDAVIPPKVRRNGPTVGEYFLYAVFNRLINPCSKKALPDWYRKTAIQQIRPVDLSALTSQCYWESWSKVGKNDLEKIADTFFQRVSRIVEEIDHCFLFDTTNYYTYMAGHTVSDLAQRGKSKDRKDHLRQIGVALLVDRKSQLPLYYRVYRGNRHDSKIFHKLFDQITSSLNRLGLRERPLTLIFDKGMNSEENIRFIDETPWLHFITSYSSHFAEHLVRIPLNRFQAVETRKNQSLPEEDRIVAWRTQETFWGREQTVVVTYNPRTAAKQRYHFDRRLLRLQELLIHLRSKVATQKSYWTQNERIEKHVQAFCEKVHLPKDLYDFAVERVHGRWKLVFRKNHYRIGRYLQRLGKNILVTDHHSWSTEQIVQAALDRYVIEKSFRDTKATEIINVVPIRHWTDDKIRCHIFTCIVALAYLRLIEHKLRCSGLQISPHTALREMRRLHSCLYWSPETRKPRRIIEEPTEIQAEVLRAFGHRIEDGVLQKISS